MEVAVRCLRPHHHGRDTGFGGALVGLSRRRPPPSSAGLFRVGRRGGTVKCSSSRDEIGSEEWLAKASPYEVLGVDELCTLDQLKAAFRARVKEFHPDVCRDAGASEAIIRRVIQAYQVLSNTDGRGQMIERECTDPFEEPECEAFDIFVDETRCIGRGCPYSCVKRAPHAFSFNPMTGAACASSQGHGDDYLVQLAVGQCPRNCIYYVSPLQRVILEEILSSILNSPYATPEVNSLDSLLAKAKFENNRHRKPKRPAIKNFTQFVDWF
ncbi:chaperone protein dnaJ C76, chloroplastic isoform X2 [Nymphaea colorata]|uniref:chaperone protein dnaJ C76, chloroplastic isoform X2 n=1 Tax=Nymphaea colorata TaxID=210225 RepID=UPI00129D5AD1|nr:chaperone protein dnaJ C76, chloroplastic isoform X2 [Nymphaea colorata]